MDKRLDKLRKSVDKIDDDLLRALNDRAKIVQRIGRVKAERGEEIVAANRERQILDRLAAINPGPLPTDAMEEIFRWLSWHLWLHSGFRRSMELPYARW